VIQFPGFMKLYIEGTDDEEDEESRKLPALKK
jgi:DNA topoisomerase-1